MHSWKLRTEITAEPLLKASLFCFDGRPIDSVSLHNGNGHKSVFRLPKQYLDKGKLINCGCRTLYTKTNFHCKWWRKLCCTARRCDRSLILFGFYFIKIFWLVTHIDLTLLCYNAHFHWRPKSCTPPPPPHSKRWQVLYYTFNSP